ncbi:30S ribosomal protein S2 [Patescibacteria group bacterium]
MAAKYKVPKIEELFEAGVHYGHQTKRWHPNMEPYIYTVRKKIHIIDLEKTEELLKKAADFLYEIAKEGGKIIFVGTKKQAGDIIEIEAKRSGALYITERWLGGTITNHSVIKKNNIDKLIELKRRKEAGELEKYTKKERLLIDREIEKLERYVGGISTLSVLPKALFVIDAKKEKTAVLEAKAAKVPVVALADTNTNPENIDYLIPGNDDAIKSIALITKTIADAIEAGIEDYGTKLKKEEKEDGSKKDKTT